MNLLWNVAQDHKLSGKDRGQNHLGLGTFCPLEQGKEKQRCLWFWLPAVCPHAPSIPVGKAPTWCPTRPALDPCSLSAERTKPRVVTIDVVQCRRYVDGEPSEYSEREHCGDVVWKCQFGGRREGKWKKRVTCVSECYEQISKCLIIVKENTETGWRGDLLKALFTLLRGTSFSRANRRHQEPLCLEVFDGWFGCLFSRRR